MSTITLQFPSLFETAYGSMQNSAKDLLNGLKVKKDNTWYLVGNLAKRNGINPGKITNAAPTEEDFDILFRTALINLAGKVKNPVTLTIGFPFATYNVFKLAAEQYLSKRHFLVEYDTQTFNIIGQTKRETFDIEKFEVIPEIVGGIIGLKKKYAGSIPENFIAISFGFGTMEATMVSSDGLIQRTSISTHGIRYAINNITQELNKKYYLQLKNEHQIDDAFIKGSIFINRKRVDIAVMRKEVLLQYYREVVSPILRGHFTDMDFESCEKIYLLGGGAYYCDLTNALKEEFESFIPVVVAEEPEKLASIGYLYNSLRLSDNNPDRSVGIDLGNAFSMISYFTEKVQNLQP
jgi:plasmid segregation protein ParM